jgi:hypothetical protein
MQDNPNNNQPIINSPTTLESQCPCGAKLQMPFPPIVVINHVLLSAIEVPHTKGTTCPQCNQYYAPAIVNYQLAIGLAPADKPILNDDTLIVPATNVVPFHKMT